MNNFKFIIVIITIIFGTLLLEGSSDGVRSVAQPIKLSKKDSSNIKQLQWIVSPMPSEVRNTFSQLIELWYKKTLYNTHNSDTAYFITLDSIGNKMNEVFYNPIHTVRDTIPILNL